MACLIPERDVEANERFMGVDAHVLPAADVGIARCEVTALRRDYHAVTKLVPKACARLPDKDPVVGACVRRGRKTWELNVHRMVGIKVCRTDADTDKRRNRRLVAEIKIVPEVCHRRERMYGDIRSRVDHLRMFRFDGLIVPKPTEVDVCK